MRHNLAEKLIVLLFLALIVGTLGKVTSMGWDPPPAAQPNRAEPAPAAGPVRDWFEERFDKRFEERFAELEVDLEVKQGVSVFVTKLVSFIWAQVKKAIGAYLEAEVRARITAAVWAHWEVLLGALLVTAGTAGVFGYAGGRLARRT